MEALYKFGVLIFNNQKYTSDLIIYGENIRNNWWRKIGHELCVDDIKKEIELFLPSILIVGTGKLGMIKILAETNEYLESKNIKLISCNTDKAVRLLFKNTNFEGTMGALHLTC